MLASNVFYETTSFFSAIPSLPHYRESSQGNHFVGQVPTIQDNHESLARASTFITFLERNLHIPNGSKSPLQTLLERSLHLSDTEENKSLFAEITQAFFKQKGYLSRLFSNESWEEWSENRTALGKVASQLKNCIESRAEVCSFTKEINPQLIQKANEETSVLLKGLGVREMMRTSKSSCLSGLTGGIAASLLFKNPLPLLLGMSECFPRVHAQQKVGSEFRANTYTTNDQAYPSVASFSNGNFVVTWESTGQDGSSFGVYGQLFDGNGTKIGSEFQVNTYTNNNQGGPSVASFSNGNFVVTWRSSGQDGSGYGVYGQIFDGTGAKSGNEFRVNTYSMNNQQNPSVGSLTSGNFVVAWDSRDQDGSGLGVYGQVFNGTGSKIGSEFRINTFTNGDQDNPSVASLNNNTFVVSWESSNQDYLTSVGVFGQLINESGSKVGSEFQVNNYTRDHQGSPSVTGLDTGNFVVTWYSKFQDGSTVSVFGQLFNESGEKIRSEFRINTLINGWQGSPSVVSIKNNHFIVTWQSLDQDGSDWGVFGQLFDENGSKIENEFPINIYIDLDQSKPAVASLQNNNFIIIWHSNGQDGSGYGIYGQIFNDFRVSSTTSTTRTTSSTTPSVSSSTTSTTKTISSTISSVSSSTISAIDRTRTSMNPSSSITVSSTTTRPITTSNSRATLSAISDPSNRLPWIWFLLGGVGAVSCLGLTGYFIFRSRDRKKDGDVHAFALEKRKQTDDSTAVSHYQRTPDFVTEQAGQEPHYGRTPDCVTAVSDYQFTPDVVAAGAGGV